MMKVENCQKCPYFDRRRWSTTYYPADYHPIGMTHAYAYCNKYQSRCLDVKKCSEQKGNEK